MKVKRFFSKHIITVVIVFYIVTIGLLLNYVHALSDEAIINSTFDKIDQIGLQYQTLLTNTLNEAADELEIFSEFIVDNNIDSDNIVEYMNSQSHATNFDQLYYIELDGTGISKNNETLNFSDNLSFQSALKNETYVEAPYISFETSEVVFNLAIPVLKEQQPIAVLYSEVSVNDFFDIILRNKNYEGDIFFVDDNLSMIFSTSANHRNTRSIPEMDVAEMGIHNVIEAQNNIQNKQNGKFHYDYFGTSKVMVYYPLEMTNFALALNAHTNSISSEIIRASDYFVTVDSIIYWTVIILVIWIAIMQHHGNKRILKLAYYDALTELPNMTKLKIDMEIILKKNNNKEYSIIIFDIANFKAINEIFGYATGDAVLKSLKGYCDMVQIPSLITSRIGDDKFAMFALSEVLDDLDKILVNVMDYYDTVLPELKDYAATYKIGRYKIDKGDTNVEEIISKVNLAHNKAKETSGEFLCEYDDKFKKILQAEAEITNRTNSALANKEFKTYFQPKFEISENKLIGAEALVRWVEPTGEIKYPNDFIPLFERNGFIVQLDNYILEQVCITLRKWNDEGLRMIPISVNCSRLNLQNPNFVQEFVATVNKYNIEHKYIEIELTESTTIENAKMVEQVLVELHNEGFRIAIDDFGSGYSSLGMLTKFQVDTLKMDRSFFVDGKNTRRDGMLIDSIVKMAHNLKMHVVAEGIETEKQIEFLRSMNCDAVQGYCYDKPMSIDQFEEKYRAEMEVSDNGTFSLPLISRINDVKYAISFVPSGFLVAKLDEHFTLVEANDYYFEMIGYTREEVRDDFKNQGLSLMTPEKREETVTYFKKQMQENPKGQMNFTTPFTTKSGEILVFEFNGKVAEDEHGELRLYTSVMDITDYIRKDNKLQNEKDFNARIAALTNNAFFEYDRELDMLHFSMDFAERFKIPNIIENLMSTRVFKDFLVEHIRTTPSSSLQIKGDGAFCAKLPSGDLVWYDYSYKTIYDEFKKKEIIVGLMIESTDRNKS